MSPSDSHHRYIPGACKRSTALRRAMTICRVLRCCESFHRELSLINDSRVRCLVKVTHHGPSSTSRHSHVAMMILVGLWTPVTMGNDSR